MDQISRHYRAAWGALGRLLLLAAACTTCPALSQETAPDLARGFAVPPVSAQPRVYWWWLESYLDRAGITRDLEEMKHKGIGGALVFDAGSGARYSHTVQQTPAGPPFMSPAWRALFQHALQEADRLGLEISLNMGSGWDCGGPWVTPELAAQRLVWSETAVTGPARLAVTLPVPPGVRTDLPGGQPYYRDVALVAVPENIEKVQPTVRVRASSEEPSWPAAGAVDGDLSTIWVSQPAAPAKGAGAANAAEPANAAGRQWIEMEYPEPYRASAVFVAPQEGYGPYHAELQYRRDDGPLVKLAAFELPKDARPTVAFAEVRARCFRLVVTPDRSKMVVDTIHNANRPEAAAPRVRIAEWIVAPREEIGRAVLRMRNWRVKAMHVVSRDVPCDVPAELPGAYPQDRAVPRTAVLDLSNRLDQTGRLDWDVPPGRWSILRFGHTPTGIRVSMHSPGGAGLMLDHLSAAAMDLHFANTAARVLAQAGPLAGKSLKYFHCDSWEVGQVNWTPDFPGEFQRRRGYSLRPFLPALAGRIVDNREVTDRFYYDFRKTVGDCIADNHYGRFRELAHRHGVLFHPESGGAHHVTPLDALKSLGRADIPMGEFWAPAHHGVGDTEALRFLVRPAAAAAHLYGSRLVNAEAFTSLGPHWEEDPYQLKPVADRAFCEGANRFFFHTFTHSPPEAGKPGYEYYAGTHFNPQITWWQQADAWTRYIARCQFLLQQGRFVADVCYYYGDHVPNTVPLKHVDPSLGPGYDYDVTDAEALVARMSVRDGRIVLPDGLSYRILVLPERETIDLDVLRKVADLVQAGATVVGPKPLRATGLRDYPQCDDTARQLAGLLWGPVDNRTVRQHRYGQGKVVWGGTLRECLLSTAVPPDFEAQGPQPDARLDYIHRTCAAAEIYFVANQRDRWEQAICTFRVAGKAPELWQPDTGRLQRPAVYTVAAGRTAVPLRLPPYGSEFVVFRQAADLEPVSSLAHNGQPLAAAPEAGADEGPCVEVLPGAGGALQLTAWQPGQYVLTDAHGQKTAVHVQTLESPSILPGPWTIAFPAGGGAPPSVTMEKLASWTASTQPGVRFFSGTATYKTALEIAPAMLAGGKLLMLDLGEVRNLATVRVNGRSLGVLWKPPFRVEITAACQVGLNTLEVDVTNLWPNRLIGDEFLPPEQRIAHTNVRRFTRESPLLESGLLGPVRLLSAEKVLVSWPPKRPS